jgi:predicted transcriptional regulator
LITTRQVKAARALLGWSQGDLAQRSGVSEPTIARLESAEGELGGRERTGEKIRKAIENVDQTPTVAISESTICLVPVSRLAEHKLDGRRGAWPT